jgi:hypothetical protein
MEVGCHDATVRIDLQEEGVMKAVFALPNAECRRRAVAIICAVATCRVMANAQSDDSELAHARDEFISKMFTKCGGQTYYFGPYRVNHLGCTIPNTTNSVATAQEVTDCAEMIEYKDLDFAPSVMLERPGSPGAAEALHPEGTLKLPRLRTDPAGVERTLLLITYTSYRSRMRVTSRSFRSVSSGTSEEWDSWEKPIPNITPHNIRVFR